MDRLRTDLIRRARVERLDDVEQANPEAGSPGQQPHMQERRPHQSSRSLTGRPLFPRLFQRGEAPQHASGSASGMGRDEVESPKSPDFDCRAQRLPSQTELPSIERTLSHDTSWPRTAGEAATSAGEASSSASASHGNEQRRTSQPVRAPNPPESQPRPPPGARTAWFHSPDPAEVQLAHLAEDGRRRMGGNLPYRRRQPPQKFLLCFPWIKSRRVRNQILQCFVSGLFLACLLSIYLVLSMTKNINTGEMTIMLILVILFATVFFCYGLIRLCMLVVRGERDEARRARAPPMFGPGGYAVPSRPIPVVLARDEEAAGVEGAATKTMPPAYGLWRESVRVDPDRLFWQRNAAAAAEPVPTPPEANSGPRPPSYASEDGVSYIVEAVPRSTVPTTDVPLPQPPSEWSGRPFGEQTSENR